MPQQAWLFCRFDQVSIFDLRLDIYLSIRLWAFGFRTVGSLDELIGSYCEGELYDLIGRKDGHRVIARLHDYCIRRLHEAQSSGETS